MIDALINGKLHKAPQQRTSKNGKPFTTATLKVSQQDGTLMFASLVAFDPDTAGRMMALTAGDALVVAGSMTLKTWLDKEGQVHPAADVVVHGVLSAYHVKHKREVMQAKPVQPAAYGGSHERMG